MKKSKARIDKKGNVTVVKKSLIKSKKKIKTPPKEVHLPKAKPFRVPKKKAAAKKEIRQKRDIKKEINPKRDAKKAPRLKTKDVGYKPKKKKTKNRRKNNKNKASNKFVVLIKIIFYLIMIVGLGLGILLLLIFRSNYNAITQDITKSFWQTNTSVNIYDVNDEYVTSLTSANIEWVDLCKGEKKDCSKTGDYNISPYYINGLIDTEDYNFYDHGPINIPGLVKATVLSIFTDSDRGGSTLSMQLGKILYMQEEWLSENFDPNPLDEVVEKQIKQFYEPLNYKFTQMSYAMKIEQHYSKEEIIENLVNVMYFGNNVYGIENASEFYFNKSSSELNLVEGATLAGITNAPTTFDPYVYPEATIERRNIVLLSMLNEKTITKEEYDEAIAVTIDSYLAGYDEIAANDYMRADVYRGYVDQVTKELYSIFGEDLDLAVAGLDVYTALDPEIQQTTFDSINNPDYYLTEAMQSGSATLNTENGEIIALGMGKGQVGDNVVNYASEYYRQPGSTSKPVLDYAPAIEYLDWSTAHVLDDSAKVRYTDGPQMNNANNQYKGEMTIAEGAQSSRNTIALATFQEVVKEVGLKKIHDFGKALGFKDLVDLKEEDFNEAYSIGGWTIGTTPLEIAAAYATFSNKGIYNEPHTIRKIVIDENSPLAKEFGREYIPEYDSHSVMGEDTAYIITDMLDLDEPDAYYFAGTYDIEGVDQISGKTGTSDWGEFGSEYGIPYGANRDNWIVTYTPDVVTSVWQGYPSEAEKNGEYLYTDLEYYKMINKDIMTNVANSTNEDYHNRSFIMPPNVVPVKVKKNSWPPVMSEGGSEYMFIKGSKDYKALKDPGLFNRSNDDEVKLDDVKNLSISYNDSTNTIDVKFDEVANAQYYQITAGNFSTTTKTPFISIDVQNFVDSAGCSSPYEFKVVAVNEKNGKKLVSKESSTLINIDFSQSSYCKSE